MPKLTFVIGANATGKTYFIKQNYEGKDVDILNVYDYQQRVYDEEGFGDSIPIDKQFKCLMRANNLLLEDIVAKLSQGRDVVVEQTFYRAKRRIVYIDEIRKIPDVTIEVYMMSPGDEQWKRNLQTRDLNGNFEFHKEQKKSIEFPNVAEGFDAIYEVVDGKIQLRMEPARTEIVEKAREELRIEADRIQKEEDEQRKKQELLDSMKERKFWHYCEVCGRKEYLTAKEAFQDGWDYPPEIGQFRLLGPRTCGNCQLQDTLFWKIHNQEGLPIVCEDNLTPEELVTWHRIRKEPESLLSEDWDD